MLRIGTLGAARITPGALLKPAALLDDVEVAAVAARDPERGRSFAAKHGIPKVHASYEDLIADPSIDAVYNPLPNSLHAPWTIRALEGGKHVLCEKPFTSNEAEAAEVAAVAGRTGLVVMEAFHYRYHPLAARMLELVAEVAPLRFVETRMCIPLPLPKDIRYRMDLAGGAVMDVGSYALHQQRLLTGEEPEVVSAHAKCIRPEVDRWMTADLRYPSGTRGRMTCALLSARLISVGLRVQGERGSFSVLNPTSPQAFSLLTVRRDGRTTRERPERTSTYLHQLRAFAGAVAGGPPPLTPPADAVANMAAIDAVYRAAGLRPRGT